MPKGISMCVWVCQCVCIECERAGVSRECRCIGVLVPVGVAVGVIGGVLDMTEGVAVGVREGGGHSALIFKCPRL